MRSIEWKILPGRKVAHAVSIGRGIPICGQCNSYIPNDLLDPKINTRCCEQCLICLTTGIYSNDYKFFIDYIPIEIKVKRRKKWKQTNLGGNKSTINDYNLFCQTLKE